MNHNEILELMQLFEKSSLEVMELGQGENRLYLKKMTQAVVAQPVTNPISVPSISVETIPVAEEHHKITSPMVGTFYRASNPESAPFVQIGDTVKKGDVLCIIEAMKMLNEIQSDVNGVIVDILVENSSMVDFGKVLFLIEEKNV